MRRMLPKITLVTVCCLATLLYVEGESESPGKKNQLSGSDPIGPPERTYPPRVIKHPPKELAYKVGDRVGGRVELPCVASAVPQPTYSWIKDGEPLVITGTDIKKQPGTGTLIIEEPLDRHEGIYQCFAKNDLGTALSMRTSLKQAILEPFDTVAEPKVHEVEIGANLVLRCAPPKSYPTGTVYWGESTANNKFQPLVMSKRVAQDYEGNLWIANVKQQDSLGGMKYLCNVANNIIRSLVQGEDQKVVPYAHSGNLYYANVVSSDSHGGATYVCVAYNNVIRGLVQGDDSKISPKRLTATPQYRAPKLEWHSETPTTAIVGTIKRLKCIFSGYPTPEVTWKRKGNKPILEKNYETAYGMEMTIAMVEYEDAGLYECSAINMKGRPPITKVFDLNVESLPEWVKRPEDVRSAEEENAEFFCEAGGSPPPKIQWTINGRNVEELPYDPRRVVTENSISYTNLTKTDAQVLQCNASNKHGYIFENAYLNVAAEPPSWNKPPEPSLKVAVTQDTNLTCRVFGAPQPKITWKFNGEDIAVQGQEQIKPRFTVLKSGDLNIVNILDTDRGDYECHARNKFGQISGAGTLVVRNQTMVTKFPESQVVNASSTIVLECEATTDPNESSKLTVEWKYKGEYIDYAADPRVTKNNHDNSLKIVGVSVDDTGEYTCVADNGLDTDEATATITVQDKPDPPQYIRLTSCGATTAEIEWTWRDENDNNNEVIDFIVYYNTSFDEPDTFHKAKTVQRGKSSARIELSPWGNYTFHVRARNSLGLSDRSEFTYAYCTTPADIPYRNPKGVCVDLGAADELVIVWEAMPRVEHNGEDFHYRVGYKAVDVPGAQQVVEEISEWEQDRLVVKNVGTFQKYEIFVQAANKLGTSPDGKLRKHHGHSGEAEPLDSPQNFAVDEDSINSTSAIFTWDAVDESPERVQGHFRGYKIKFWKSGDEENARSHEVILRNVDICPPIRHRGRNRGRNRRQTDNEESGHVLNLWPFSKIIAGVLVLNGGKEGSLSDTIEFDTPEGVPGIVPMFEVREVGSHHFGLAWSPPLEPNGIITGYIIGFQEADGTVGVIQEADPVPATQTSMKLRELEPSTRYRLYVWATTSKGRGVVQIAESTTKDPSAPDKPGFATVDVGEESVNISWVPTEDGPSNNPGSKFYVLYKKQGEDDDAYVPMEPDGDNNWLNISGLDTGDKYEFVIVAVNGDGTETRSDPKVIQIGPREDAIVQNIAKAGWFVVMMCAIAFLLLILIIVCLIKRNRGGKYPVHEKEKLRGRDPDKDDEEGGFGEYTKTDEPDYKKSAGSLESETKPLGESDTDSMAEYGDMDAGKFNEDGSFIGQYGGKKKPEEKMEPDATSPNALSTFV